MNNAHRPIVQLVSLLGLTYRTIKQKLLELNLYDEAVHLTRAAKGSIVNENVKRRKNKN